MDNKLPENMRKRKLALVLLDIMGSTAFVQRHGAVIAAKVFQYHDRLTRSLIYKYNGREIDRSDGFFCSFNSAVDALNFGLHYQREVPSRTKLKCRIGIHVGDVVEVQQEEFFVAANAKRVELEGISKNIAARIMSVCGEQQVLLSKEALKYIKHRSNKHTPKHTLYACAGLYLFKGVKSPMEIYIVAEDSKYLIPPESSEKVKRLGGPKKIKLRMKHKKIKDWLLLICKILGFFPFVYFIYILIRILISPVARSFFGLYEEFLWLDNLIIYFDNLIKNIKEIYL